MHSTYTKEVSVSMLFKREVKKAHSTVKKDDEQCSQMYWTRNKYTHTSTVSWKHSLRAAFVLCKAKRQCDPTDLSKRS